MSWILELSVGSKELLDKHLPSMYICNLPNGMSPKSVWKDPQRFWVGCLSYQTTPRQIIIEIEIKFQIWNIVWLRDEMKSL